MERIVYNKTLDVHKNGVQFVLQGFETADKLSRRLVISLMASGDAIDFPLEQIMALMYVKTPSSEEQSIIECEIKDNTIIYDVLPIVEEGITEMQLKIIETRPDGAKSVLATPKFAIEVLKSNADDESVQQKPDFSALVDAVASAKEVYDRQFDRMELSEDCIFRAYYVDGRVYETDVLKRLFNNGNALLSQSFAKGGTGVRTGEDTDNSMYYSNVARSASAESKAMKETTEDIFADVQKHGLYTGFSVDFTTGEVEYVSPSYDFKVNEETGELDIVGRAYTFEATVGNVALDWIKNEKGLDIDDAIKATADIETLKETAANHTEQLNTNTENIEAHEGRIDDIESGNEWIRMGTLSYESGTIKFTGNQQIDTHNIITDEKLGELTKYSKYRYVLKKGSTVEMNVTDSMVSNGTHGHLKISGADNLICEFGVGSAYGDSESKIEKAFTIEEDIISTENNIERVIINGVYDYEKFKNITAAMQVTNYNYSTINYKIDLEIQVRK